MSGIHKTEQEFLGVDVDEVSLVDNPAIEEEWLVVKRLEGKSAANAEAAALPQFEADIQKEREKQEAKKMGTKDVKKSDGDTKPDAEAKPGMEKASDATPEATTQEADVKKAMELFEQANALLTPHKPKAEPETEPKPDAEAKPEVSVVKALIGIQDGRLVIDQDMLEVAKAKTFSKGRTATLETATKAMINLLKEVAPDAVQKIMGGEASTQKSTEPEGEPRSEQLTEVVTEAVTKAIGSLDARLKELEGATATPKSADGDQQATVKKSNDSVWSGSALSQ